MRNAANPDSVAKAKREEKDALDEQRADMAKLLAQPEFRRYVWRLMHETCGLLKSASNPNGSIQSQLIGMQDVGRRVWTDIEAADALAIPLMMREHHEAQKRKSAEAA